MLVHRVARRLKPKILVAVVCKLSGQWCHFICLRNGFAWVACSDSAKHWDHGEVDRPSSGLHLRVVLKIKEIRGTAPKNFA